MANSRITTIFKNRFLGGLNLSVDILRIGTILAMTWLIFIQVILRVFLKWASPVWEEASRFLLIWSIMAGIIVTSRRDEHIKMDLLPLFVHSHTKRLAFEVGSNFISFLLICIFAWWSWDFLMWSIKTNQQSYILSIPMYVVHISFVFCAFVSGAFTLVNLIDKLRRKESS